MTIPVPVGVRVYDLKDLIDSHITRWVEDFSFRHTAPGGCASCTIKLHVPPSRSTFPLAEQWGKLYNRVQIYDTRSAEVLWEGRVEDPVIQTGDETWELGVLGSSVAATDINIPVLYADNTTDHWNTYDADAFQHQKDDPTKTLITRMVAGFVYNAGDEYPVWTYAGASMMGSIIARASCTYDGSGPNPTQDNFFDMIMDASVHGNIDITAFDAATVYKSNIIPTDLPPGTGLINQIYFEVRKRAGTGNYTIASSDNAIARFKSPRVLGARVNRFGTLLLAASDYNHGDFVYVRHVVEDVVGRFLNCAWKSGIDLLNQNLFNDPFVGSVKGEDCFIDTTDTHRITNLKYPDGTDAKGILDSLMQVQTNAYWAIWESNHLWRIPSWVYPDAAEMALMDHRFRFEWARWPNSWNYLVSSQDGMSSQEDGEDIYNRVMMQATYEGDNTPSLTMMEQSLNEETAASSDPYWGNYWVEALNKQFTRSLFVKRENPITQTDDALAIAAEEARKYQFSKNTGTVTVRRKILMVDSGTTSFKGFMGMIDPWEIRPGKLVKIQDVMPAWDAGNTSYDNDPFPNGHQNCIFRVVGTTYSTSDNSCTLELDQIPKWRLPTQIVKPSPGGRITTL